MDTKTQVSLSVKRIFLWLWAYEKAADGTLYLNVTPEQKLDEPHFHNLSQAGKNRWNHQSRCVGLASPSRRV